MEVHTPSLPLRSVNATSVDRPSLLRPSHDKIESLDFDQRQRYAQTARLLDAMFATLPRPLRVLEVGCNILNLLPEFLDPEQVQVVRCDVERFADDEQFVLIQPGQPLPFEDDSFDAVVCLEVLEHVAASERKQLIEECLRVGRYGAVLTAPNGCREVDEVERSAALAFQARHGRVHPFLAEHHELGLPTESEIVSVLTELGYPFRVFDNAPLETWLPMLLYSETFLERGASDRLRSLLQNVHAHRNLRQSHLCYRKLYVVTRSFDATTAIAALSDAAQPIAPLLEGEIQQLSLEHGVGLGCEMVFRLDRGHQEELRKLEGEVARLHRASLAHQAIANRTRRKLNEQEGERLGLRLEQLVLRSFAQSLESSLWWRMTQPLRWLRELLWPRGFGHDNLIPWQQLKAGQPAHVWEATGTDPQFIVPCYFPAGWVRIRARLHSDVSGQFRMYADLGHSFQPHSCIAATQLPCNADILIDEYVYLNVPCRAVRIDPLDCPGQIHISELRVEAVPAPQAFARALTRWLGKYSIGKLLSRAFTGNFPGLAEIFDTLESKVLGGGYDAWRAQRKLTDADRERMRRESANMTNPPLISILMPTYETPIRFLREALDSVLKQSYSNWELCIADDASTSKELHALLDRYAKKDARIRIVRRAERGNISRASNSALEIARGDYIALFDHDDLLAEHALFEVAKRIVADRQLDMIYSDEDKLSPDHRHIDPFFKPDWSPDFFLSCMYTCHLGVYRTSLIRALGGFRPEFDTAQDYDLVLRVTSRTNRIAHIPDILYHWRQWTHSTALDVTAKPQAELTARRAIQEHIERLGRKGRVDAGMHVGTHHVHYDLVGRPLVSIIIPTASRSVEVRGKLRPVVLNCVESIRSKSSYSNLEIIVVDNDNMSAEVADALTPLGVRRVTVKEPFNFSTSINRGATAARGEHLLLLNDDTEVINPDWLEAMLQFSQQSDVAAVGARLTFPDGALQHVGVVLSGGLPGHPYYRYSPDFPGHFGGNSLIRNYSAVTAACLMTRVELFHAVGGFDPRFPLNFNDVDYCLRVRQNGMRIVYTPYAQLVHFESLSKAGVFPREIAAFRERWGHLPHDPHYGPNFAADSFDYALTIEKA